MESVSDYSDSVQEEKMDEQAEILENGFNPDEQNCGNCDRKLNKKPQDAAEETASCPVVPKRAALLYPLKPSPVVVSSTDRVEGQAVTKE